MGTPRIMRPKATQQVIANNPGVVTRSGKPLSQHLNSRGKTKDRTGRVDPEPPESTPQDRLNRQRSLRSSLNNRDNYKPRAGESD